MIPTWGAVESSPGYLFQAAVQSSSLSIGVLDPAIIDTVKSKSDNR